MAVATTVSIQPSVSRIDVGAKFRVAVHVDNVTDLYTWQADIHWDPAVLRCDGVTLGPFAPPDYPILPAPNNTEGWWIGGSSFLGDKPGNSGSGDLVYLDFTLIAQRASPLALIDGVENTFLLDSKLGTIPCTLVSGAVYATGVDAAALYGVVTDAQTRKPIVGATATLDTSSTTTVRDGFYCFSFSYPPGTRTLKVSMSGYIDHTQTIDMPTSDMYVKNVALTPASTLQGTVTNSITGAPVKGATITLDTAYSTTTDENGNYSIMVTPATYSMTVYKAGYIAHAQDVDLSTPGTHTKNVSLTPEQYTLTVQSEPISVPVTINGSPAGNTPVSQSIYCESSVTVEVPATQDGYKFTNYTLNGETHTENPITFTMPANNVTLTAHYQAPPPPTATLKGRITGIFGPVANATVRLDTAYTAKTDASGFYQITNITPGTYTLTIEPPFPWSLIYAKRTQTISLTEPTTYELTISLSINKATVLATTATIGMVSLAFTLKPKKR